MKELPPLVPPQVQLHVVMFGAGRRELEGIHAVDGAAKGATARRDVWSWKDVGRRELEGTSALDGVAGGATARRDVWNWKERN